MPVYHYKGVVSPNRRVSATIDADSLRAARTKLKSDGVYLTQIEEGHWRCISILGGRPVFIMLRLRW